MDGQTGKSQRAIISVFGRDRIGIIAWVSGRLQEYSINILDINQTILQGFFTMIMIVDLSPASVEVAELARTLEQEGKERGLQVNVQHEDIFNFMHRI
ncbi:hypothetical protein CEB3_c24330 [Peptococcaceae bacterium CEB3]|nr:hypothetical protein CEB3_c24330 [Peptococcaceae bacterium CEB3]